MVTGVGDDGDVPLIIGLYIHTYIHTYIYTYIHTYMSYIHTYMSYIHTYIHTYIHIYIHIHTYIHTLCHIITCLSDYNDHNCYCAYTFQRVDTVAIVMARHDCSLKYIFHYGR